MTAARRLASRLGGFNAFSTSHRMLLLGTGALARRLATPVRAPLQSHRGALDPQSRPERGRPIPAIVHHQLRPAQLAHKIERAAGLAPRRLSSVRAGETPSGCPRCFSIRHQACPKVADIGTRPATYTDTRSHRRHPWAARHPGEAGKNERMDGNLRRTDTQSRPSYAAFRIPCQERRRSPADVKRPWHGHAHGQQEEHAEKHRENRTSPPNLHESSRSHHPLLQPP